MKRIGDKFQMGSSILPYVKFALSKTEAYTLSALVYDEECDDLFSDIELDLVGNSHLPVPENAATVNDGKNPVGP